MLPVGVALGYGRGHSEIQQLTREEQPLYPPHDLNGDGTIDLVFTVSAFALPSELQVLFGGDGLGAVRLLSVGSSTWSGYEGGIGLYADTADVDGDGIVDLVMPGAPNYFSRDCSCQYYFGGDLHGGTDNGGVHVIPSVFLPR